MPASSVNSAPQIAHQPAGKTGLLLPNLLCMGSMFAWASGLPAAEVVIDKLPSEQLGALRVSLAALCLLPIWLFWDGAAKLRQARWLKGIAVGSLIALSGWFIIIGQTHGGPVTAAVITAAMPLIGIGIEVLLEGRRITKALVIGLCLALLGGVLALDFRNGELNLGLGAFFSLLSILCFTMGSRLTVTSFPELSLLGRVTLTLCGAAVTMCVIAVIGTLNGTPLPDLGAWQIRDYTALAVFALMGLSVSQILMIASINHLGIGMSSLHSNAAPFYVMLLMTLVFGAAWSWQQAGAAALVGLGVVVAQGILPLGRKPAEA